MARLATAHTATAACDLRQIDRRAAVHEHERGPRQRLFRRRHQEDILTNLALVGDLDVISRTSVMGYRDTNKSIAQIGRELGVAFILEGSVRRAGNTVRVTGQLIDARTGLHLWARAYDRELNDVFAIQAALAKDIVAALHAVLTPQDVARLESRPTDNVEAYDLYLQARAAFQGDAETAEGLGRAEELLKRAVQLDPRFALAWVELAYVHLNVHGYRDHTAPRLALAKAAIETATRLAPDAPEAILGMANYLGVTGDGAGRNAQVQRVIQAHPNHPRTLMLLAWQAPSPREALAYFERARRLDPRNPQLLENMSGYYLGGRRYDEALALAAEANALLPPSTLRSFSLAMIPFQARGATGPVESFLAQLPPGARLTDPNAIMAQAQWAYVSGDAAGLIRLWEQSGANWRFAPRTGRLDTIVVAQALIILGDARRARALLEKNRDQLMAGFDKEPDNGRKWADLALIQAMLGDAAASQEAEQRARQLTPWIHFAATLAWRGDKDGALAELARTIPGSGEIHETNIHELRRSIGLWPLWDDPRFAALLDDPKNNAPLW